MIEKILSQTPGKVKIFADLEHGGVKKRWADAEPAAHLTAKYCGAGLAAKVNLLGIAQKATRVGG